MIAALILSVFALLVAIAALAVAIYDRRQMGTVTQDFHAVLDALDQEAAPAPIEPAEARHDYGVLDDVGRAIAARKVAR